MGPGQGKVCEEHPDEHFKTYLHEYGWRKSHHDNTFMNIIFLNTALLSIVICVYMYCVLNVYVCTYVCVEYNFHLFKVKIVSLV